MANNTMTLNTSRGTLLIAGQPINDFISTSSPVELNFENENTSFSVNADGDGGSISDNANANQGELTVRVEEHSVTDRFLNSLIIQRAKGYDASFKEVFTRDGTQSVTTYEMTGGGTMNRPNKVYNVIDAPAGMEYKFGFLKVERSVG